MAEVELAFSTAAEQGRSFRAGELSPVELVRIYLQRIERYAHLNAYITVRAEQALRAAESAEQEFRAGRFRSPLHGVPVAVKDQMMVDGVRMTGGSKVLSANVADRNATVVARLEAAGAIVLGTLNTHEFHYGPTREFPYGLPRNPWDPERSPGGSSSGSAAAVAAGLCTISLGGDTGGSIRGPASFCGVVGLKPTWSRVSRDGVIPLAWSLDCVGPLARSAEDVALALEVIAGADPRDPTSSQEPVDAYGAGLDADLRGLRVAVVDEMVDPRTMSEEAVAATHAAAEVLRGLGASVGRVSIPLLPVTRPLTSVLVNSEAASHHRKWLRSRYLDYDGNSRIGFMVGALFPAGLYVQAERMRSMVRRQVMACFDDHDLLLGPSADVAPLIGTMMGGTPAAPAHGSKTTMPQTQVYNLVGNPAVSVLSGFDQAGLPLGVQMAARHFDEARLLRAASAFERNTPWRGMARPPQAGSPTT